MILGKPDRFVAILRPFDADKDGKVLYQCVLDGAPFETEEAACNHVLSNHLEHFFSVAEVEVEPPKGNFPYINKCGITAELIGPPNYHRYQMLLQSHVATRLPKMSVEQVQSKLETVSDEESVQAWIQKMSTQTQYTPITAEGQPPAEPLESLEVARAYLMTECKGRAVRSSQQVRVPGTALDAMPQGDLKRSIETVLAAQNRFPLETANNLRGRLRRLKFTIYKRGSKGVSIVCAVKRRFREPHRIFADPIDQLIVFIEAHPGINVRELPEQYLGIDINKPVTKDTENAPAIEKVDEAEAAKIVEKHEIERQERLAAQGTAPDETPATATDTPSTAAGQDNQVVEPDGVATEPAGENKEPAGEEKEPAGENKEPDEASVESTAAPLEAEKQDDISTEEPSFEANPGATESEPQAVAATASETTGVQPLSDKDHRLRGLMNNLRWLVTEGYVTEMGDGSLFAQPPAQIPTAGKNDKPKTTPHPSEADSAKASETDSDEAQAQQPDTEEVATDGASDSDETDNADCGDNDAEKTT